MWDKRESAIDSSVNFINRIDDGQAFEARYVRRHQEYVACYLSTQTGCHQSCRMCHLTFTGQNKAQDASVNEIIYQAEKVLEYYNTLDGPSAQVVHYNFMARGEPFNNRNVWNDGNEEQELFRLLADRASNYSLFPRFLISTIMPTSIWENPYQAQLRNWFPVIHPEIYYSLYSMDPSFRRRWLPKAQDPDRALEALTEWQRFTKKIIRIHYALIKGENDRLEDAHAIVQAIKKHGLRADFSLVRYNPPSDRHGEEASNYDAYASLLRDSLDGVRVKTVDRVGQDVAASCGMFLNVKS